MSIYDNSSNLIFVQMDNEYYLSVVQERNVNSLNISTVISRQRQFHPTCPSTVQMSMIITIIMFIVGFLKLSIASLLAITMFALKFAFLLLTQMSIMTNKTFLFVNCLLMDIIRGIRFNKQKSKRIAI